MDRTFARQGIRPSARADRARSARPRFAKTNRALWIRTVIDWAGLLLYVLLAVRVLLNAL